MTIIACHCILCRVINLTLCLGMTFVVVLQFKFTAKICQVDVTSDRESVSPAVVQMKILACAIEGQDKRQIITSCADVGLRSD